MLKTQEQQISSSQDIKVVVNTDDGKLAYLSAYKLAESAIENKIDFVSFVMTLDKFSDAVDPSKTSLDDVYQWREIAVGHYISLSDLDDPKSDNIEAKENT